MAPILVTCALTGAIHMTPMSLHLPVTPDEMVAQGTAAAARDGAPSSSCSRSTTRAREPVLSTTGSASCRWPGRHGCGLTLRLSTR
ncbi:3-keto-5-aminohexanoate cleavage protein [Rhodosalinus sp.]|uniref:3-keto-5-aminohexanoate cleavage protein n=1 Tax=Rhodosalinus sp. TaxID=2047741 RepID=UPI0035623F25